MPCLYSEKTEFWIYFYFRNCPHLLLGSISPDVTTLNPDLVNCRISYFQITQASGSFFSGSHGGSFLEKRAARKRADETPCCCIFTARCLTTQSDHERDWQSCRKFFFRKSEEVVMERNRSRVLMDKDAHKGVSEQKKKNILRSL